MSAAPSTSPPSRSSGLSAELGVRVPQLPAAMRSVGSGLELHSTLPPESEIVAQLLDGQPVFVADAATDPRMVTGLAREYGPVMLLPLQSGRRVLGALVTPRARGERPFTETERTLAIQFASQAPLALMMAEAQRDR